MKEVNLFEMNRLQVVSRGRARPHIPTKMGECGRDDRLGRLPNIQQIMAGKGHLALLLVLFYCTGLLEAAVEKPNIVMIIADDQTYRDFGFMGNALVQTPNIDRLASLSARYVNGYVPTSVCSPS
ncbi:MAG: sulfatase-like hydrolase/transferase, partial [Verrucomicrobia bacterium]|nr:sulfatase-like hydrolase/transferase [Verrucomicrobiota bacterium]